MRKIVFFDVQAGDRRYYKSTLKNVFNTQATYTKESLSETTAGKYSDAAIVSVSVTSNINAAVLSKISELEFIASRSTGHAHIDISAARTHDVLVSTVPSHVEDTVAEHTIMLLLALTRRLRESTEQVEIGFVDYTDMIGAEVAGKTIGIIGCGKIGRRVGQIAKALNMEVVGYDPYIDDNPGITCTGFEQVLAQSDVVSLHAPLTGETRHLIDSDALGKMKKGAMLLNTAEGDLVDTQAVIDALYSGHISAAGLDVLEGEQLLRLDEEISLLHPDARRQDLLFSAEHDVLRRMSNVIITPHNGFNSHEALQRIRRDTSENIKQYLRQEPRNLVVPG